ncbi:hypothetical protein CN520_06555 [Bacillus cereus]|nr:hypothetical protein COM76_15565 [Bacillus cereus]PGA49473.1 hypothetical protein COL88_19760 [Bacillus thuringiensis]PEC79590.1 hypothetical protein CON08_09725 [Bacillus cereus]PED47540.1 hypothetical protein CON49_22655 [Bacillus cereus]PET33069.1 hypothetical protein CN519_00380 [Bacillus cereus]
MLRIKNEFHIIHIMEGMYMKEQYKIIVLSDELSGDRIRNTLDKNKCKTIVHVVDVSDVVRIESSFQYIVIWRGDAEKLTNDLINRGVQSSKIINLTKYMYEWKDKLISIYQINPDLMSLYISMKKAKSDPTYELFATGLSYPHCGISTELLSKKSIKLTLPSQDLYYDYLIASQLLSNNHSFQYCLIGIAYFSFYFDMSLSSESYRIHKVYYPLFQDGHHTVVHSPLPTDGFSHLNTPKPLLSIFNLHFEYILLDELKDESLILPWINAEWNTTPLHIPFEEHGKIRAASHAKLSYPHTLVENKMIFKKYLDLLLKNDIEPLIVVFPVTSHYFNCSSKKLKEDFYKVINDFQTQYSFQIIDLFDSPLFCDDDFYDSDHMNKKGANKMSALLNMFIQERKV